MEIDSRTDKIKQIAGYVLVKNVSSPSVRYVINVSGEDVSYLCNLYKDELASQGLISKCLTKRSGKI